MAEPGPVSASTDAVRVSLKVTPGARKAGIGGIEPQADGGRTLKVAVTAAPEGGKANAAVLALLSRSWRLPKSSLTVERGATDRRKVVRIATGEPAAVAARIEAWLEEQR